MDQPDEMIVIYTTFSSEEDARKLGGELIQERLAACVNIFPGMLSLYRWLGNVEEGNEVAAIIKTRKSLQDDALALITSRHPYAVPALLVFQPQHVAASYFTWLLESTHSNPHGISQPGPLTKGI